MIDYKMSIAYKNHKILKITKNNLITHITKSIHILQVKSNVEKRQERVHKLKLKINVPHTIQQFMHV